MDLLTDWNFQTQKALSSESAESKSSHRAGAPGYLPFHLSDGFVVVGRVMVKEYRLLLSNPVFSSTRDLPGVASLLYRWRNCDRSRPQYPVVGE